MAVPVREWMHWVAGYGVPRASLNLLARHGDPLAQLLTFDMNPVEDIYPLIEQVRRRGRVSALPGGRWVTADVQIAREVLRDDRFRTLKPLDRSPLRLVQWLLAKTDPDVLNPIGPPSMLVTEPPEHTRLRHPVARAFTPRALDGLRARIHEVVDGLLRELEGNAECDLVADYTSRIPLAIIVEMMAMPAGDERYLQHVGDAVTGLIGNVAASWREFRSGTQVLREYDRYLGKHLERLRNDETSDSILSSVVRSGDLTETELRMLANLLVGAGFITTSHVMGKAVVALVRHPDQLAALRANPDGWPGAIEEILRYDTAGQVVPRIATEDVDVHGCLVRAGKPLFLLVGGANRDPIVFENPNSLDTARANAREHISFSTGIHVCLGAALARMELHIGLQSLFERFPQLALAGEPTFNKSIGLHGLTQLPVSLGPAHAVAV